MIYYLEGFEIDRIKWDNCVSNSLGGHVYGLSWYLDMVAPGWAGLVKGDYEWIMPLLIKRKFGISYLFQPIFAQQTGVIGKGRINEDMMDEFIKAIPGFIRYADFNLNFTNAINVDVYKTTRNLNFELNLEQEYPEIKTRYASNTRRNVQMATKFVKIREKIDIDEFINLKRKNPVKRKDSSFYKWMFSFVNQIISRGYGEIVGAETDGKICAAAFFVKFRNRSYYLIPVSDISGKQNKAMFAIVDHQVRKYSGSKLILDFEGSGIPGIARFFGGFGAIPVEYLRLRFNNLPFFMKFFKR